jgi:hypothetical protein
VWMRSSQKVTEIYPSVDEINSGVDEINPSVRRRI